MGMDAGEADQFIEVTLHFADGLGIVEDQIHATHEDRMGTAGGWRLKKTRYLFVLKSYAEAAVPRAADDLRTTVLVIRDVKGAIAADLCPQALCPGKRQR
ncbi:hypothetical protein QE369_000543 [Agrobacterium larrymoorei]|uniref:Uncharacterized protein n=1 Tax=Agrobacterium larrymoorei TaxID=160699 RepID=A0AAJ2B6P0_9HYPH|nr:hypothetical protein [Agrobacterium larrymoorei]